MDDRCVKVHEVDNVETEVEVRWRMEQQWSSGRSLVVLGWVLWTGGILVSVLLVRRWSGISMVEVEWWSGIGELEDG